MATERQIVDDHMDDQADDEIGVYLDLDKPKSFFLFAGAGSGKTRSLVTALNRVRERFGTRLRLQGRRIAVITYTNAACDEITRRLDFDPLFAVSTIHSFVWELIKGFHGDIRLWLQTNLDNEIVELESLLSKGRPGTKTAIDRQRSIQAKKERLATLPSIKRFIYSPTGDNRTRDSLNHSEVIKLGAEFLTTKPVMQSLLLNRFPVLLIDESQDTNRLLMEAFLALQAANPKQIVLGLFGDMMQRIYADGKIDLGRDLPADWAKPAKKMNHRSPHRIIRLINLIRSQVDEHQQQARSDAPEGHIRMFVTQSANSNKAAIEKAARARMAQVAGDPEWEHPDRVKTLTLEHHMAAKRLGFLDLFEPLYKVDAFKTGLRDGSLPVLRLFSELVLPLVQAKTSGDEFGATAVIRQASPLLSKKALEGAAGTQMEQLKRARGGVESLMRLWENDKTPRFVEVLTSIAETGLFEIPDSLRPFVIQENDASGVKTDSDSAEEPEDEASSTLEAIRQFLETPFSQIRPYSAYVRGETAFTTHQGVKGLEFPRVMVVIDDEDAGGFLFSYEKLLGVKEKTTTDLKNEREGTETSLDRTRRLLYVTCSRSQKSLALVAYTADPARLRTFAIGQSWFKEDEIEVLS